MYKSRYFWSGATHQKITPQKAQLHQIDSHVPSPSKQTTAASSRWPGDVLALCHGQGILTACALSQPMAGETGYPVSNRDGWCKRLVASAIIGSRDSMLPQRVALLWMNWSNDCGGGYRVKSLLVGKTLGRLLYYKRFPCFTLRQLVTLYSSWIPLFHKACSTQIQFFLSISPSFVNSKPWIMSQLYYHIPRSNIFICSTQLC